MGELFPGGPVTLPTRVSVAGTIIEARWVPAATIAYHAAASEWGDLARRFFDYSALHDRLADPADDLDGRDLAKASIHLAIRASGAGPGIEGWRVMVHMAGVIVREWMTVAGRLATQGINVETAQYWQVIAATRLLVLEGATPEYKAWLERTLEYPLPMEPACVEGAGSLTAVRARSRDAFADLQRELGGD
jgi:hypothetical protein